MNSRERAQIKNPAELLHPAGFYLRKWTRTRPKLGVDMDLLSRS
jgi:hypothetical protein